MVCLGNLHIYFFKKINFAPILNFELIRDPIVKIRLDFLKVELDFIFFLNKNWMISTGVVIEQSIGIRRFASE